MKSYFNVPDNINSTNRHLGIKKNIRKDSDQFVYRIEKGRGSR